MTTAGMMTVQAAPRDPAELAKLAPGVRYRIAYQVGMFADESQEQAFMGAPDDKQCEALSAALQNLDVTRTAQPTPQTTEQPQMPPMYATQQPPFQQAPQQPMLSAPAMPPMQVPVQQPAATPASPPTFGQPQMPQVAQPPMQIPVMQPPATQPAPPKQQLQAMPPQMPQAAPQMPTAPPMRSPVTSADPNNGGATLGILRGLSEGLKRLSDANEANKKLLTQVHEQNIAQTKMFEVILTLLLVTVEQNGVKPDLLAKLYNRVTDEQRAKFLNSIEGAQGKG